MGTWPTIYDHRAGWFRFERQKEPALLQAYHSQVRWKIEDPSFHIRSRCCALLSHLDEPPIRPVDVVFAIFGNEIQSERKKGFEPFHLQIIVLLSFADRKLPTKHLYVLNLP
jgi:hypothetical protein